MSRLRARWAGLTAAGVWAKCMSYGLYEAGAWSNLQGVALAVFLVCTGASVGLCM